MKHLFLILGFALSSLLYSSCNDYPTTKASEIPKDDKELANGITQDFFNLCRTAEGVKTFKSKKYITPKMHVNLHVPGAKYTQMPLMFDKLIGEVFEIKLLQMVNKGVIKTFRYKIICEKQTDNFVEFAIDLNKNNNLASVDFYAYLDNKTRLNLFTGEID